MITDSNGQSKSLYRTKRQIRLRSYNLGGPSTGGVYARQEISNRAD